VPRGDPWAPQSESDSSDDDPWAVRDGERGRSRSRSPRRSLASPPRAEASGSMVVQQPIRTACGPQPLRRPTFESGTEWWAPTVWDAYVGERAKRPQPGPTEFRHESFCSGSIMENFGARAMKLQGWRTISAADIKQHARLFCVRNFTGTVEHMFTDFRAQIYDDGERVCDVCTAEAKQCTFRFQRPHLAVGGLPCQPFTRMRYQRGVGSDERGAEQHSKYATVFGLFAEYLTERTPRTVIIEEVVDFDRRERGAPAELGTPLERLMGMLASHGYFSQALHLDSKTWIDVARPRLFIIAIDQACGGAEAVRWVSEQVQSAVRYREVNPPLLVWSVLPTDTNHTRRREAVGEQATDRAASGPLAKWKAKSALMRDKYEIPTGSQPWSGGGAALRGVPENQRCRDVLDVAWACRLAKSSRFATRQELAQNFWADASQRVSRAPWGTGLRCLTQNSLVYSFERDTILSGFDHMRLQGAPISCSPVAPPPGSVNDVKDVNLRSLAGEAFSCPVVTCVAYAMWLNPAGVWWTPQP